MNDFQEKKHQLKQIDFCCLRLLQLGNIAKVRLWTAQMSFKSLKLVSITKIYFMLWIGLDIMVGSKFIKPIYLNWFMILNLKKYESICHKCDHESVSSLHKYPKFVWLKPRKWKYQCSFVRYLIEIFEIWSWVTNLTQNCFFPKWIFKSCVWFPQSENINIHYLDVLIEIFEIEAELQVWQRNCFFTKWIPKKWR